MAANAAMQVFFDIVSPSRIWFFGYLPSVSTLDFASLFIVLTVWLWSVAPVV